MTFTRKSLFAGTLVTISFVWLSTYIPIPSGQIAGGFHITLAIEIVEAALYVFSALIFISSIQEFRNEMRKAYLTLAIGFCFLGLSQVQNPIFQALNQWASFWVLKGGLALPVLIASVLLFLGTKKFAELNNIKYSWASFGRIVLISALCAAVLHILPHRSDYNESLWGGWLNLSLTITSVSIVLLAYALAIALKIRKEAVATFVNPWAWLIIAYTVNLLANFQIPYFSLTSWYVPYVTLGFYDMWFLFAGLCILKAAYAFHTITER